MSDAMHIPLVTVITIAYNDAANLKKTIENVKQQNYPKLEYIVIDGGSTDGSQEVIQSNAEFIDQWVSEKDKGIFDAMNKGVLLAKGEYINFMNAGDWFLDRGIITKIFNEKENLEADLIYGDHEVHYPTFVKKKTALSLSQLWKHMVFSHQTLFTKKEILLRYPFDLRFKIAADFHFVYNCHRLGYKFKYTALNIAAYLAGGQSETKIITAYKENQAIVLAHNRRWTTQLFHKKLIAKQKILVLLRSLIAESFFLKLMKWKNHLTGANNSR
ncbi:MAG: glycosyltransferase family 2 protein [Bacteroidota bacterium]